MAETLELGGNISLTGFSDIDGGSMIILKKIVGTYAKKFSEEEAKFKKLELSLKNSGPYEIEALLKTDKEKRMESSDENLFVALDNALKNL